MAERSVVSSMMPLPQLSLDSGRSSGRSAYFVGPKIAPWVQARKRARLARSTRLWASAKVASAMTMSSKILTPRVTLRLLYLSAKYPPGMENMRKGTAKSKGTTRKNHSLYGFFSGKASRIRKLTSHFRALSLKAFWNWTATRVQKPERLRGGEVIMAELARLGAPTGAAGFEDVGTGFASVVAETREGQEAARDRVP